MKQENSVFKALPVLFGFFVMGFCDIVGISSDYVQTAFGWSDTLTGFVPSMVFVWFLFLGVPTGMLMNRIGRKNTVQISMTVTFVGMILPLIAYDQVTVMIAYALLGIGNAILQVSLNPLLNNVITNQKMLTSTLTAGQVVKAVSSFAGPIIVSFAIHQFGGGDEQKWYYCFPILGAITLLSALWLMATPIPQEKKESTHNNIGETFTLLQDKKILLLFFGIFFVVGVDVATNFISSKLMLTRFDWTKEEAGMAPQVYFICRTAGAFIGMFLMTRIADMTYFRVNILLCIAAVLTLAFFPTDVTLNLVMIGAIGFLASCIFPIIYSMAVQARPDKANLISGLMITAVAGGGAVTPAIGAATDAMQGNYTGGVFVILICVLYLTYCAFGIKVAK